MSLTVSDEVELVRVVVVVVQLSQGDLVSTSITLVAQRRMFLYYLYTILLVHPIEVVLEAYYGSREPGSTGEGSLTLSDIRGEADLVDLG